MKNILIFLAGAAAGSLVTWKLIEHKYAELADKEINSVVETFKKEKEELEKTVESIYNRHEKSHISSTKDGEKLLNDKIISQNDYSVGIDTAEEGKESVQVEDQEEIIHSPDDEEYENIRTKPIDTSKQPPYIIDENEYGEFGNDEQTLIFYEDGILADEDDEPITDIEDAVGEALVEFANDPLLERLYVRNEQKEIDFIILKSEKSYKEVYGDADTYEEE